MPNPSQESQLVSQSRSLYRFDYLGMSQISVIDMNSQKDGIFPDEVVLQILARLPIKALHRIKTTCKLWYILCSETYFMKLYNQVSAKNPMVLVEVSDSPMSKPNLICVHHHLGVSEFSLGFLKDRVRVRASCNGLLCCSSVPDKGVFYICNPMTREFKVLPRSRDRPVTRFHPDGEATLVGLACDPYSCSATRFRFNVVLAGYHRSFGRRTDGTFVCLVFDSESNKWSKFVSFRDDSHQFTHMNKNQVVFVNRSLHWLTSSGLVNPGILVLDLEHGCSWKRIALPEETLGGSGNRVYLLELGGFLSVVQISETWMSTWVKREDWELVDRVSLRCIRGLVPGIFPICQSEESVLMATHKQVLVYQRKSRLWKEMYSVKNNSTLPLWFSAHAYRSTIFSCR